MHPKPTRQRRRFFLLSAGLLSVFSSAIIATILWPRPVPPISAFHQAREALSRARNIETSLYAADRLMTAEKAWDNALNLWQSENARWYAVRDYSQAREAALYVTRKAGEAAVRAETVRDSLFTLAVNSMAFLQTQTMYLRQQLEQLPYDTDRHRTLSSAETLLTEAERALERRDYWTAAQNTYEAAERAEVVSTGILNLLNEYLGNLPLWQQWRDEIVAWSAANRASAVIIDKMARNCRLYSAGHLKATYAIEMGPRWIGDKNHEGDMATPEGQYYIARKLGAGQTMYHRALLIDYPNEVDCRRFDEAVRRGDLSANTRIGERIEIHGQGGRGINWTKGCVALSDSDIETLFANVNVGTPVTIVGALEVPDVARRAADMDISFSLSSRK